MKAYLVAALLALLALTGCRGQVQTPSETAELFVNTPSGPAAVTDVVRNEREKKIEATIVLENSERYVTITPLVSSPLPVGFSAELVDGNNGLLARVEMAWDPDRTDRAWIKEQTSSDEMTASLRKENNRIIEEYIINGETFSIDYPSMDPELRRRAAQHYMNGESLRSPSPELQELIAKFTEFEAFYSLHAGNTLHNSPEGDLLVSLITNEQFVGFAVGKDFPGPQRIFDRTASRICALATICGFFKCFIGGWMNFICVACTGTSLACALTVIGCWIFGCD